MNRGAMTDYETTPPPDRLADTVQLRTAFSVEQGDIIRFMIQLEYWLDGEWQPVVRYDHNEDPNIGHDIAEEGLHMDIYRDSGKYRVEDITGPIPAADGFDYAEDDLRENVQEYIKRFEKWHGIRDRSNL